MIREKCKLRVTLVPILVVGLLVGTGFLGKKIWDRIDRDIFNHPRGDITEKTPGTYGLSYEQIDFETGNDLTLKGWYVRASTGERNDCIILAPGKTENRWDMLKYAPFLADAGFDVLLFDPRSTGHSEGDKYGFGYYESRDLVNAADYLLEKKEVEDLALLGRSAGATASLLAAKDSEVIEAVVADSPFANLKLASKDFGNYSSDLTLQLFFPVYMWAAKLALGVDIYDETNALNSIDDLKTPVLFIHGLEDEGVGYQNSEKLFDRKGQPKKLWLVPETDHVKAFENEKGEYRQKVVSFFDRWL